MFVYELNTTTDVIVRLVTDKFVSKYSWFCLAFRRYSFYILAEIPAAPM
jgi:hypothetical protein